MNASIAQTETLGPGLMETLHDVAIENVERLLRVCDEVRRMHRAEFLLQEPSAKNRADFQQCIPWLIRALRLNHSQMADPSWPHREIAKRIETTLWQLEQLWESENNPMSDAEADKLLKAIFPA